MSEVISVLGTLSGTIVGLIFGFFTAERLESRKEKHEREMAYCQELTKHIEDIIKPLYHYVEELWSNLAILNETTHGNNQIGTKEDWLAIAQKALRELQDFCFKNESQISLILPNSLSTWVLTHLGRMTKEILTKFSEGKKPYEETLQVVNALMKYQENIKKLIGYETEVELEDILNFPKDITKVLEVSKNNLHKSLL